MSTIIGHIAIMMKTNCLMQRTMSSVCCSVDIDQVRESIATRGGEEGAERRFFHYSSTQLKPP